MKHPTSFPLAVIMLAGAAQLAAPAQALTDGNAELKADAADRSARVVVTGKAVPRPAQAAWVPTSPKRLDSFRPVLPPEPVAPTLARAEPAGRR